jgi:hypothetical protein
LRNIVIILAFFALCGNVWAEENAEHYCDDENAWVEWVQLIQKYPDDDDLRTAYALRLGLCQEVKAGTIETKRAIKIFERFMSALRGNVDQQDKKLKKSNQEQGI